MPSNCLNCNTPVNSSQKFCSECGQKQPTKRLSLHEVGHDLVHYFTHADKGIFQLIRSLTTHTGLVAKEYVKGKRKKYFPPLNFFLIVAAMYVFMGTVLPKSANPPTQKASYVSSKQVDDNKKNNNAAYQQKINEVGRFFGKYSNFVAMFAVPLISLFIWLFFKKGPYQFTEHLIANLYLIGYTNLARCLIVMPIVAFFGIPPNNRWPHYVFMGFEVLYRSIFYYRFMDNHTGIGKLKAVGSSALAVALWQLIIITAVFVYVTWG